MGTKKEKDNVELEPKLDDRMNKPFLEERFDCSVKYWIH